MSSSLGFKLSVAGGGTAATASAAAGGLYLSSSSDSSITNDSLSINKESPQPKQTQENLVDKNPSSPEVKKEKQIPQITPVRSVYSSSNQGSTLGPDTIGGRYYFFLAGTTIDPSVSEVNKASYIEWWNQKYNLWKEDENSKKDEKFQKATEGFDDSKPTALNKVCEEVYKLNDPFDPKVKPSTRTVSNLEHNYWRYCSDLDEKPKSLVEAGESNFDDNDPIGHYDGYGHVLAATGTEHNNKFWKLRQEWYESLGDTNIDPQFKTYSEGKKDSVKIDEKISLRKVCETTKHLSRENGTVNLKAETIVKYCGFSEHLYKEDSTQD